MNGSCQGVHPPTCEAEDSHSLHGIKCPQLPDGRPPMSLDLLGAECIHVERVIQIDLWRRCFVIRVALRLPQDYLLQMQPPAVVTDNAQGYKDCVLEHQHGIAHNGYRGEHQPGPDQAVMPGFGHSRQHAKEPEGFVCSPEEQHLHGVTESACERRNMFEDHDVAYIHADVHDEVQQQDAQERGAVAEHHQHIHRVRKGALTTIWQLDHLPRSLVHGNGSHHHAQAGRITQQGDGVWPIFFDGNLLQDEHQRVGQLGKG
mmetsp:Transcript_60775/g.195818  ORF Transcript_60775/g.195818 Transcript_60775/m.195818 type:complete len:259 (-) Transcript_60775:795-1571(-)